MNAIAPSGYATRMSLFFGAFFFPFGVYLPFFGVWLKSLGIGAEEIGLILTIPMITRVLFTPFMAAIADKIGDRRLALQLYCTVFALTFALITLNDSLIWIASIMALSHIAQSAIVPIADSLAMAGTRRFGLDYGRMRSWGSLSFLSANLIGGVVLDAFGASYIIWLIVISNIMQIVLSLILPMDPRLIDKKSLTKGTQLNWNQLRQFAQSGFWLILFATSLVQGSHGLLYAFGTIYWQNLGISANMTGIFWSVSVLSEVLLFVSSKRISKYVGWKSLLIIGAIVATIRWLLLPIELNSGAYLALQLLHAASFGCSHLGTMFFIAHIVDDELSGTAQGLFTMLTGLLLAAVTSVSGMLYAQWSGDAFYFMAAISLVATVLLLLSHLLPLGKIRADLNTDPSGES